MSKKATKSPQKPPTVITLTLPDEGGLVRTGTILIQRGALAALRQFTYSDLAGITRALQDAAAQLMGIEKNPPPDLSTAPTQPPQTNSTPSAPDPANDTEDSDEAAEEGSDEGELDETVSEPGDETPAPIPASESSKPVTLSLF